MTTKSHEVLQVTHVPRAGQAPRVRSGVLWYRVPATGEAVVANEYVATPPVVRPVTPYDLDVLSLCDGEHTLAAIAAVLHVPLVQVADAIQQWESVAPRMFVWSEQATAEGRFQSRLQKAVRIHREWRAAAEPPSDNVVYHRRGISDATHQFDQIETTVSHAFRSPHRALRGRTYGEAFCDALLERRALRPGARILEIGGGVGYFALAFLTRLQQREPDIYRTVRYTLLDLSPTLQESQRSLCQAHTDRMVFALGDIETLDLPPACADVVLANEMIADLSIGTAEMTHVVQHEPQSEAEFLVQKYNLDWTAALPRFAVNVGAIRLVEHLASWLAPDGTAVITEYGSLAGFPTVLELDGHNEYSIHFGHLEHVGKALHMDARAESLGDFLEADGDYEVVRRTSLQMLRYHLLPYIGAVDLPARTYDLAMLRDQLGELWPRIGNIRTARLRHDGWMTPFVFYALTLSAVPPSRPLAAVCADRRLTIMGDHSFHQLA